MAASGDVLYYDGAHQAFGRPTSVLQGDAPVLEAIPTLGGVLLSDVLTYVAALNTWLGNLRADLIARGIEVAP